MFSSQEELGTRGAKIGAFQRVLMNLFALTFRLLTLLIATRRIAEKLERAQ